MRPTRIRDLKMKKILFILIAAAILVPPSYAQDVITLTTGNTISALVQEVGNTEVKYKRFDNPNGPNYTLNISDIYIISYANGTKDVFSDIPTATQQNKIDYESFVAMKKSETKLVNYLKANDTAIYTQFKRGTSLGRTAGFLGFSGFMVTAAGAFLIIDAINHQNNYYQDEFNGYAIGGAVCAIVGPALLITCIPINATGRGLKRRAINNYVNKYYPNRASFDINYYGSGIGLAYKF